jgi:hypothetical protein
MLFGAFRIASDEVERALGRPLDGDPSRGERWILALLNKGRLGDARRQLEGDVKGDFRALLKTHFERCERRWGVFRLSRVSLRKEVWEFYAREARKMGKTADEALTEAVERDFASRTAGS